MKTMDKIWTIARRELKSYFDSPVAYIVLVAFLLVAGWMLFSTLFLSERADMRIFFNPSFFSPTALLVIIAPAISMRLMAEERKTGTLELLTSMPISDTQVVAGKFLAALLLMASGLALTLMYPITISNIGPLDWGPVASGYLGVLLFSGTLLAIGLACSSITDNQVVAFILSFLICAALYFVYWLQFFLPYWLASWVGYLSVSSHLSNMAKGVIDTRDILYYLTLTGGALFLAERFLARQHA
jgi:ABC-2 type transport system permease protein